MTAYRKTNLTSAISDLLKWAFLIAAIIALTSQIFLVRPVQAASATPSVKKFSFTDAWGKYYSVTSWTEDGVKCTSVTSPDPTGENVSRSVSISCVKL